MSKKNQKQQNKTKARDTVEIAFTAAGWDDYQYWQEGDASVRSAIDRLINECIRTPFTGTGKPEGLKGDLSGYWSRRITKEHRLVYFYEQQRLTVIACRHHY